MEQEEKKAFIVDEVEQTSEILRHQIDHFSHAFRIRATLVAQCLYGPMLEVGTVEAKRALLTDLLELEDKGEEVFKVRGEGNDGQIGL